MHAHARWMVLLTAIGVCGCQYTALGPSTIPVLLKNEETRCPIEDAVAVSLVQSTGWFPYIEMESKQHDFDKVRIEGIARIDPKSPFIRMPHHLPGAGCVLALIINEDPEVIFFSPGYEPGGKIDILINGYSSKWSYKQSAYAKDAVMEVLMHPLPETEAASRPTFAGESDKPNVLINDTALWNEFRSWYSWGKARDEIALICRSTLDYAQSIQRSRPRDWTPAEQATLDWCRTVVGGK